MTIRRKQMKSRVFRSRGAGILASVWFIGAFASFLLVSPVVCAQERAIEGQPIAAISIVDSSGKPVSQENLSMPLAVGQPFDYSNARDSAGGLHLQFIVTRNFYNNVVRVEGLKAPPTEAAALAAMRLSLGEPFRESALQEAVDRLKDTLHAEGLFQADVKWILTPYPETRQMDVRVIVTPGPRATMGNIVFKNQTPFADAALIRRSGVKPKNTFTSARITRASQKLKKYLVNQGYLGAGILITSGEYDAQTNLVPLTYSVTTGPKINVSLSGEIG